MRASVTGGTGFIGEPLVRRLLSEGAEVRVLARPSPRADQIEAAGSTVIRADLADVSGIQRAVEGADVVFHIAAKVNPPGRKVDFFETNAGGTERVLREALAGGVRRVVYLSSISVYGLLRGGEPIDETTGYDPRPELRDFYAQSKIAADQIAVWFATHTSLPVTILRPGLIYGPGRALPLGLLGFTAGGTNIVFGKSNLRVPLNFTENLLDAMQLVAHQNVTGLREYIIVDDEELTLGQYHAALREFQKRRTVYFPGRPLGVGVPLAEALLGMLPLDRSAGAALQQVKRAMENRWYVARRLRQETGWTPRVTLREAIRKTLQADG